MLTEPNLAATIYDATHATWRSGVFFVSEHGVLTGMPPVTALPATPHQV